MIGVRCPVECLVLARSAGAMVLDAVSIAICGAAAMNVETSGPALFAGPLK